MNTKKLNSYKKLLLSSVLYDEEYYKAQFKEEKNDYLEYYLLNGHNEDKNPSAFFDTKYYLETYPDVQKAGLNPLVHYLRYGAKEGRATMDMNKDTSSLYDLWCVRRHSTKGIKKAINDFKDIYTIITSGKFDGNSYLDRYPDAKKELTGRKTWTWRYSKNPVLRQIARFTTTPVVHYVKYGMYRNQDPNYNFSTAYYMNNNPDLIHGKNLTPFVHYIKYGEREMRKCHYFNTNNLNFNSIYISKKQMEKKYAEPTIQIIDNSKDIKNKIALSDEDLIWINGNKSPDLLKKITPFFNDEAIFAMILDSDTNDFNIVSYTDVIELSEIAAKPLKRENVIFKNPNKCLDFDNYEFNNDISFTEFILKYITGSKVCYFNYNVTNAEPVENRDYYEKILPDLLGSYISNNDITEIYSSVRGKIGSKYDDGFTWFKDKNFLKYLTESKKLNIMVGIFAFTHGGGEIMPIRLANKLYEMGHNVTVHIYSDRTTNEALVRNMLIKDIPVIYTSNEKELALYIKELNIQVITTHHQAIQSLTSLTLDTFPELFEKVLHIATSHGMYENFSSDTLNYMFCETPLDRRIDYWTYVADKNIIPFQEHNIYNKDKFIKIPNGMEIPVTNNVDLSEYGIKKDSFVCITVSRALKEKGWLNSIEAVKIAREKTKKDIHLLLVGSGEVYDEYSQSLSNDFIHFLGFRDNPCDYINASDLFLLPSYYPSESAPLCLIEAMMCGKPSIASDIGDVRYMLDYNGNICGDIVSLNNMNIDNKELAEKLINLVTNKDFYDNAVSYAKEKSKEFEIKNVCHKYLDAYNKVYDKWENYKITDNVIEKLQKEDKLLSDSEKGIAPLVSVIVPNYNHSAYLPERLDCIFNQTYKNIEVLLLDDCSKDNSREILTEYAKKYPKAKLLFNETNSGGVFYQWAKGVKNSSADICWIAESDDYCDRNFLEKLVPAFEDKDVKISYCQYIFVNEKGEQNTNGFFNYVGAIDKEKWHNNYVNDSDNEVETALAIKNTIPNASGAIFRKPTDFDLFDDENWYKMKICGDWIFYLYIIHCGKVSYCVDTKSYFRFHSNNSSAKTYINDTYYTEHEQVAKTIMELYAPDESAIRKNHEIIKDFYHSHIKNGSDKDFEKLYNLDKVLKFTPNKYREDISVNTRLKQYPVNKEIPTIVINPVKSATDDENVSLDDKMTFVGKNSGNMVFVDAVKEQVNYKEEIWFNKPRIQAIEKNGKASIVIPASNFIIAGSDDFLKSVSKIYEDTESQITMIGLGAQAYKPNNTPKKLVNALSPFKKYFFKMAAERAVSFGIRGEFTAECLELMGIRNYRIIGCPTCYKHLDGNYKEIKKPSMDKPLFTVTGKNSMESKLLKLGVDANAIWLMQMMTELPQLLTEDKVDLLTFKKSFPDLKLSQEELKNFMRSNGKIFFNMETWKNYLRQEDFSFAFGSRFHGNMSCLREGIPALWITHDSRTSELINVLHLPHITIDKLNDINSAEELLEYCDYSDFYKNYNRLTKEYVAFLNENSISHKFTV